MEFWIPNVLRRDSVIYLPERTNKINLEFFLKAMIATIHVHNLLLLEKDFQVLNIQNNIIISFMCHTILSL